MAIGVHLSKIRIKETVSEKKDFKLLEYVFED